ncbi:phage tail fiber protein [Paenisporosarcina cavernae]|uniref:Bacteriophage T7 tail fibre protein-like N-terminal domain-containing protein n=1 Tax=Paenisporosarcina cavernae TaxID=2320858 RepID=A0A385YVV4_9BACL|nr:phage tail fiber protein [Paenisporosarcina cavernae]AYC29643.1 hypothetical protein D3873_06980 [Paenisporosarcina cavernae]AYC30007.1 hypothetical protein D3873_09030 [Paenisporosarcina cavernae]
MAQLVTNIPAPPPLLRVEPFKGINLSVTPTQIDQSQASDMLNMHVDERGALNKRTGYEKKFDVSLGLGAINGIHLFHHENGEILLLAHGTKLYKQQDNEQPVELYTGIADNSVSFFEYGGKCYIQDGTNYLVFDGTSVEEIVPYIPTLLISKLPGENGGGALYEDLNLLGAGFKETFSGDGTAKDFYLSLKDLDATPAIVKVDNVLKTITTDYTFDAITGKVTFVTAPSTGTNNVEITAYKTQPSFADRIKKCRFNVIFGGSNDTRVFVSGNPIYPSQVWRSGLQDPTYFPENGFYKIGTDAEKVQGFTKQYDYLVIEKERSKWVMRFELQNGEPSFPLKPINDQVGTIASKSIQTIENNPISLDKTGVYILTASTVRDERNVQHVSENIDNALLREPNLESAISFDHDRKYWLAVNSKVYIFDYSIGEWFIYDNIKASAFIEIEDEFYFASSEEGMMYRFFKESEATPFNDNGEPINAYWRSKQFVFSADELRKLVEKVYFGMKPMTRTSVDLYYISNKKESDLVKSSRMDLLDFRNIDFNNWSFILSQFPQEAMAKIKAKKITHFQLLMKNDKLDEGLGLLSIGIKYRYQSPVK